MNTSAQSSVESPVSTTQGQVEAANEGKEQQTQYAAALDGTGLISLDSSSPRHLLLGATVAGGWDSNPDNLGNGTASGVYILSPYLGIQANTPKAQYIFQYQPTMVGFSSSSYTKQTINVDRLQLRDTRLSAGVRI